MVETCFLHDLSQAEGEDVARNAEVLIENTFSLYFRKKKIKFMLCTRMTKTIHSCYYHDNRFYIARA